MSGSKYKIIMGKLLEEEEMKRKKILQVFSPNQSLWLIQGIATDKPAGLHRLLSNSWGRHSRIGGVEVKARLVGKPRMSVLARS